MQIQSTSGNGVGIYIQGASASVASSTANGNIQKSIFVQGASASIKSSTTSGNGHDGINITGDSTSIASSTASGNDGYGITVQGENIQIKGSRADANGFGVHAVGGGFADLDSVGIRATSFNTFPKASGNTAHGNDDPSECFPAIC